MSIKKIFIIITENSKKPFSNFRFPYDYCLSDVMRELLKRHDIFPEVLISVTCCLESDLERFKKNEHFPVWVSSAFWGSRYLLEWNELERNEKDGSSVYRIVQKFNRMLREW